MKKVLIFTVTAGEGHNSIAKALKNCIESQPDVECKIVDIFKQYASEKKVKLVNDWYLVACKIARPLYNIVVRHMQKRNPAKRDTAMPIKMVKKETPFIYNEILEYKPDAIICTHFYPATAITNLRKEYSIPCKVAAILTDYCVHPGWECTNGIDYLITPSESFDNVLQYKGFKKEQLISLGLPVNPKFSIEKDKIQALNEIGAKTDRFTVMLMMGGGGMGGTYKLFKKLLKVETPIQIIVVNGHDKKNKQRIDNKIKKILTKHNVLNYGFVNNVDTILSGADVLVGKCGGISSNESLNKRVPMVLIKKLPEQERQNMIFLTKNKAAKVISFKNNLTKIIQEMATNDEVKLQMKNGIENVRKPNACMDIVKLMINN